MPNPKRHAVQPLPIYESSDLIPLQHSRLNNPNLLNRPILRARPHQPHPLHDPQPLRNPSKNGVLAIQPRRRRQRNEELAAIRIRSAIRHAQNARAGMLEGRGNLVFEFLAIDRRAPAPRARGVPGLEHEVRDDAVEEERVVVAAARQGFKVLTGLEVGVCVSGGVSGGRVRGGFTFGACS